MHLQNFTRLPLILTKNFKIPYNLKHYKEFLEKTQKKFFSPFKGQPPIISPQYFRTRLDLYGSSLNLVSELWYGKT